MSSGELCSQIVAEPLISARTAAAEEGEVRFEGVVALFEALYGHVGRRKSPPVQGSLLIAIAASLVTTHE